MRVPLHLDCLALSAWADGPAGATGLPSIRAADDSRLTSRSSPRTSTHDIARATPLTEEVRAEAPVLIPAGDERGYRNDLLINSTPVRGNQCTANTAESSNVLTGGRAAPTVSTYAKSGGRQASWRTSLGGFRIVQSAAGETAWDEGGAPHDWPGGLVVRPPPSPSRAGIAPCGPAGSLGGFGRRGLPRALESSRDELNN